MIPSLKPFGETVEEALRERSLGMQMAAGALVASCRRSCLFTGHVRNPNRIESYRTGFLFNCGREGHGIQTTLTGCGKSRLMLNKFRMLKKAVQQGRSNRRDVAYASVR